MKAKKILKIIAGVIIFFTLPSLIFFGFIYFKYNEDLPTGIEGPQADLLAQNMLEAIDYEAYLETNYIEWTFKNRHHYKWEKAKNTCAVHWKKFKVDLNLDNPQLSSAYANKVLVTGSKADELIKTAQDYFNNDSFWLVAPYKIFDPGTERRLVTLENNEDALLVTYKSGGSTPGDSYLWIVDTDNKPVKFRMWVDILPIGGLEASWNDWTTTDSGAMLPIFHEMLFLGIKMDGIIGTK
ncbi:hypothetical protein BZARG_2785 [Bizionia argentinensis JUB59]|uniref:Uncharacterized protein n=1 Tax=Bizionia argentinensis JUB59 TaxID=1046627 RepID=G2EFH3_9FLAO|nr:hypothetical protein [Bizionia argentinensis]EGV42817.1 hypothetical protein BZARG_2785 [Bizionia argentinensis JUB59]